jgi:hypothetical protein
VQPDRPVESGDVRLGQVEQLETLSALCVVASRTECADVERLRRQRFHEGKVIELGVVGERDHRAVRVELQRGDRVVGHVGDEPGVGHVPGRGVLLARVAHDDLEVQRQRHLGQYAGKLAGADHQHPPARPEDLPDHGPVEREGLAPTTVLDD